MRKRLKTFFSGWVQGVGFRYTVKKLACGFEVTGTVRNLPDGRVELAAEGEKRELELFLESIQSSEVGHFIRQTESVWGEPENKFSGFEITR